MTKYYGFCEFKKNRNGNVLRKKHLFPVIIWHKKFLAEVTVINHIYEDQSFLIGIHLIQAWTASLRQGITRKTKEWKSYWKGDKKCPKIKGVY